MSANAPRPEAPVQAVEGEVPIGNLEGLKRHWPHDLLSGLLVFLIALPLCLGISMASGYPPIAGVFTAILGGTLTTFISNSELTIKGPAAGLIVIVVGVINDFGGSGFSDGVWSTADQHAYECALAVTVAAALLQIAFGVFRGGILGEFFPSSTVHGMLTAIGIIIIAKQIPVALGVSAEGSPLELLLSIPAHVVNMNPVIGLIGGLSLLIMFFWPHVTLGHLRRIPAALVVLVVSIPLGLCFGFDAPQAHTFTFNGQTFEISKRFLVSVPDNMFSAITAPDFSVLKEIRAWRWVAMLAIVGTLESLLSAKAIDLIDPFKRKTDLDRDDTAIGVGNLASGLVGGLPMISEIVRSRANIDNGARTRFADLFHALLLLGFVAAVPGLISLVPLAALSAMLVYTGFRLAHPKEFIQVLEVGWEQLVVFVSTIVGVLVTDLLTGIVIGVVVELVIHVANGAPVHSLFSAKLELVREEESQVRVVIRAAAMFSNWISLKRRLMKLREQTIVVDFRLADLVDHTATEKIHEMQKHFRRRGVAFEIIGLRRHDQDSGHSLRAPKLARDL